jgi:hypothetical protein
MIGRNKRGIRRASSTRVRLAIAAAVLVGGGAAGVAAVAASHGTDNVASTGYTNSTMSWQQGMSWAMDNWNTKPQQSLVVITKTVTVQTITVGSFHTHQFVAQRGTVVAKAPWEFVVKSTSGTFGVWHFNGGTKFVNIGNSRTGWNAMSGGTMSSMGSWNWSDMANSSWNSHTKTIAKGDLVFVFGTKVNGVMKAQLVLFAAPSSWRSSTPVPSTNWNWNNNTAMTATPAAAPVTPTQTVTVTANPTVPNTTVNGTPAVSSTHS